MKYDRLNNTSVRINKNKLSLPRTLRLRIFLDGWSIVPVTADLLILSFLISSLSFVVFSSSLLLVQLFWVRWGFSVGTNWEQDILASLWNTGEERRVGVHSGAFGSACSHRLRSDLGQIWDLRLAGNCDASRPSLLLLCISLQSCLTIKLVQGFCRSPPLRSEWRVVVRRTTEDLCPLGRMTTTMV